MIFRNKDKSSQWSSDSSESCAVIGQGISRCRQQYFLTCYNPRVFMKTLNLFPLALLLSCITFAQQPTQPAQPQHAVIHAGHMLDVKTGKMLENVTVVIDG